MSARRHLRLFLLATLAWVAFWVLGLPAYYQQYPFGFMLAFDVLLLAGLLALLPRVLGPVGRDRRTAVALWMSLYFTLPLAAYDYLYCGLYLGHGWSFLVRYWYVSVYYAIPWLVLPGVAIALNRGEGAQEGTA